MSFNAIELGINCIPKYYIHLCTYICILSTHLSNLKTLGGVPFKRYEGKERINFKFNEITGIFSHTSGLLGSIRCTANQPEEMLEVFVRIAFYVKWRWSSCESRIKKGAEMRMENLVKEINK